VNKKLFNPDAWNFNAVLQYMLRVKLRLEFITIVLMVKSKAFQRYAFVVMVRWFMFFFIYLFFSKLSVKGQQTLSSTVWILNVLQ